MNIIRVSANNETTIILPLTKAKAIDSKVDEVSKPVLKKLSSDSLSLQKLKKYINSKKLNFERAGKLAGDLFGVYLADALKGPLKEELMELFSAVAQQSRSKNDHEFYGFIRGALTYHAHTQDNHNPAEIEKGYKEAISYGDAFSAYYLGEFYDKVGRYQDATAQFLACIKDFPEEPYAYREMGKYYRYGWDNTPADVTKAEFYFDQAISKGCEESHFNLADMLEDLPVPTHEKRERVIKLYEQAVKKGIAAAAFNLGVIYQTGWYRTEAAGNKLYTPDFIDRKKAERYFRISHKLDPQPEALVAIGETIGHDLKRTREVKEIIQILKNAEFDAKAAELEKIINAPPEEVEIVNIILESSEN